MRIRGSKKYMDIRKVIKIIGTVLTVVATLLDEDDKT